MVKLRSASPTRGFTIVELLIVIVVIAILASITVVAFNGVQKRAQTAKYTAAVDAIVKILKSYKVTNSFQTLYQVGGGNGSDDLYFCFGNASEYPAVDGFVANECQEGEGAQVNGAAMNELLAATNITYSSLNLPVVTATVGGSTIKMRGVLVDVWPGLSDTVSLTWIAPDESSCGSGYRMLGDSIDLYKKTLDAGTLVGSPWEGSGITLEQLQSTYDYFVSTYGDSLYRYCSATIIE